MGLDAIPMLEKKEKKLVLKQQKKQLKKQKLNNFTHSIYVEWDEFIK